MSSTQKLYDISLQVLAPLQMQAEISPVPTAHIRCFQNRIVFIWANTPWIRRHSIQRDAIAGQEPRDVFHAADNTKFLWDDVLVQMLRGMDAVAIASGTYCLPDGERLDVATDIVRLDGDVWAIATTELEHQNGKLYVPVSATPTQLLADLAVPEKKVPFRQGILFKRYLHYTRHGAVSYNLQFSQAELISASQYSGIENVHALFELILVDGKGDNERHHYRGLVLLSPDQLLDCIKVTATERAYAGGTKPHYNFYLRLLANPDGSFTPTYTTTTKKAELLGPLRDNLHVLTTVPSATEQT